MHTLMQIYFKLQKSTKTQYLYNVNIPTIMWKNEINRSRCLYLF